VSGACATVVKVIVVSLTTVNGISSSSIVTGVAPGEPGAGDHHGRAVGFRTVVRCEAGYHGRRQECETVGKSAQPASSTTDDRDIDHREAGGGNLTGNIQTSSRI